MGLRYRPYDWARDPRNATANNKVTLPRSTRDVVSHTLEMLTKIIYAKVVHIDVERLDR